MKNRFILLCSHGRFCKEILESAKMIGVSTENVFCFPLMPGVDPEDYSKNIESFLISHNTGEFIFITDVFGGTPCMTLINLSQKYDFNLLAGLNLPMLLTITEGNGTSMDNVLSETISAGKDGVRDISKELRESNIWQK